MRERLERYLRRITDQPIRVTELTRMTEGYSYETYIFRAQWQRGGEGVSREFAMRMEPQAGVVPPYDIRPQYWTLKALENTPVPAPRVHRLELDPEVLGRPFFIMEKVEGEVPIPWGFENHEVFLNPQKRKQMGRNLIEVLAHLHTVDWKELGLDHRLEVAEEGTGAARREIERWERNLKEFHLGPEPILTETLLWLKENMPTAPRLTLTHGDYRLGNFLWDNEGQRIAAFLDWEMIAVGDPMSDLGWLCMKNWRPSEPSLVCNLLGKEEALDYYQELTGIEVDRQSVFYWEVLSHFKLAVIIICGVKACLDRKNSDLRLLTINPIYLLDIEEMINLLGF